MITEYLLLGDAVFLNWRYLERPDQKYYAFGIYEDNTLAGYVILKLYKDGEILKGTYNRYPFFVRKRRHRFIFNRRKREFLY